METEVARDDGWASLPPDLLLDIFRHMETTAVIRCAGACKPWRRAIVGNARSLRPHPDRFNPNLLLGFFYHNCNEGPVTVSVTDLDTGNCKRLSSLMPGVDLSSRHWVLSSRDGFLLVRLRRRRRGSIHDHQDELCLCNTKSGEGTFLPQPSIIDECQYTLISGYDLSSPSTRDEHGSVRILANAGMDTLCTNSKEDRRLTYQVFSYGGGGHGGPGIWGPVPHSDEVTKGRLSMIRYGNTVVACDAVYWLAGPRNHRGRLELEVTCTVGLDIDTGRAWSTGLPSQCQFLYNCSTPYTLTTSGSGRLSLLQPVPDRQIIQVWELDSDGDAMVWTVQHRIAINNVQDQMGDAILGFLLIVLHSSILARINLGSLARKPVKCIGKRDPYCREYYPYEMDWSTYISNMKKF